ncbi:hypothetical protein [Microbacterium resistens]|uniref:hypothetical protein n=1 Tax=Microbacterium resistens TaxID=156977 RepID=UPI001C56D957|nr:hypothetical protein [Microbacterium resistens]
MAFTWRGAEASAAARRGAARGLSKAARALLAESQARVPVDTTNLRQSGAAHDATPAQLASGVTYDTPYAVIQHERTDFNHSQSHNPGAQAKYLEGPLHEMNAQLMGVVAKEIRSEVGG